MSLRDRMPLRPPGSVFRAPAFGLEVEPPKPRRSGQEQRQAELAYDLPSPDAPFRFERLGPDTQLLEGARRVRKTASGKES